MSTNGRRIYLTAISNPDYDQRMIRICTSLANAGYTVTFVGSVFHSQKRWPEQLYRTRKLYCRFRRGFFFYAEFNLRLFFFLLPKRMDALCAVDLDTILPCYLTSVLKKVKRVYDAHELFCEMQEIVTRPGIFKFWKRLEKLVLPAFRHGYTVNEPIADEYRKMYGLSYSVIRNLPALTPLHRPQKKHRFILYQGAVNEGRCFETLIPAMMKVDAQLVICGEGNFLAQTRALVKKYALEDKVVFKGMLLPDGLKKITLEAWIGVTLFEKTGISNYFSLANRFFDYMHAAVPQICVDFPVYRQINDQYGFADLLPDTSSDTISSAINVLLENEARYQHLAENCMRARQELNWQQEEEKLLLFYQKLFANEQ